MFKSSSLAICMAPLQSEHRRDWSEEILCCQRKTTRRLPRQLPPTHSMAHSTSFVSLFFAKDVQNNHGEWPEREEKVTQREKSHQKRRNLTPKIQRLLLRQSPQTSKMEPPLPYLLHLCYPWSSSKVFIQWLYQPIKDGTVTPGPCTRFQSQDSLLGHFIYSQYQTEGNKWTWLCQKTLVGGTYLLQNLLQWTGIPPNSCSVAQKEPMAAKVMPKWRPMHQEPSARWIEHYILWKREWYCN